MAIPISIKPESVKIICYLEMLTDFLVAIFGIVWIAIKYDIKEDPTLDLESKIIISYIIFSFILNSLAICICDLEKDPKPKSILIASIIYSYTKLLFVYIALFSISQIENGTIGIGVFIIFLIRGFHAFMSSIIIKQITESKMFNNKEPNENKLDFLEEEKVPKQEEIITIIV